MAERRPKKRSPADLLDRQLEAVLNDRGTALSPKNRELSELLRLGVELRDLPRPEFRARLAGSFRTPVASFDLLEHVRTLAAREDRILGAIDRASIILCKFSGLTPWERHPGGDELIFVLEGEGEVTVLEDDGPVRSAIKPGGLFVCPKGLWHRTHAKPGLTALYVTPLAGGEYSTADDPRRSP